MPIFTPLLWFFHWIRLALWFDGSRLLVRLCRHRCQSFLECLSHKSLVTHTPRSCKFPLPDHTCGLAFTFRFAQTDRLSIEFRMVPILINYYRTEHDLHKIAIFHLGLSEKDRPSSRGNREVGGGGGLKKMDSMKCKFNENSVSIPVEDRIS